MRTKLPYIDTNLLRAALELIAMNDDPRPVTKAIHINGEFIESTNGHALVRMRHHAEFCHDITVQFNEPVPDNAEFADIKLLDDGLCIAVYYREAEEEEFIPIAKSVLATISMPYPDLNFFLKSEFVKTTMPPVSAKYLALPYLMFGTGVVDAMCTEDRKTVLFTMGALTNEIFGAPQLVAMAVLPSYFDLSNAVRDEIMGDE